MRSQVKIPARDELAGTDKPNFSGHALFVTQNAILTARFLRQIKTRTQTAKAIDYTLKRWQSLIRYARSGHLPIDNNSVENTIRPIALGKKN